MLGWHQIIAAAFAFLVWATLILQSLYGAYLIWFVAEGTFERAAAVGLLGGSLYLAQIAFDFGMHVTRPR